MRPRVSLRSLLIIIGVIAVMLSWLACALHNARVEERSVKALEAIGATCIKDYDDPGKYSTKWRPPAWFGSLFGDYLLNHVVVVEFPEGVSLGDKELAQLAGCRSVREISIRQMVNCDEAMRALSKMPCLEALSLDGCCVTDEGARVIAKNGRLRTLSVGRTLVTDRGVAHLATLPRLLVLNLSGTTVTDRGLCSLNKCKTLLRVKVYRTGVTRDGVHRLLQQLPTCEVLHDEPLSGSSRTTTLLRSASQTNVSPQAQPAP
jgi:hypothetical protein